MLSRRGILESYFISRWKDTAIFAIRQKYPELSADKLHKMLDELILKLIEEGKFKNLQLTIFNNYRNMVYQSTLIETYDKIFINKWIIGGFGCLYMQHENAANPFIDYITDLMTLRNKYKKLRKENQKNKAKYVYYDRSQLNTKIKINSLYGVLGYAKFFLYNLFLAASITSMGQHIITSASTSFEDFLSDNCPIFNLNELFKYIKNITLESRDLKIDHSHVPDISDEKLYERLIKKCTFEITPEIKDIIQGSISNIKNPFTRKLLYYKNNFFEFVKLPYQMDRLKVIFTGINFLMIPDPEKIEDPRIREMVGDLWNDLMHFVFYNYPTNDRIRKGKYTNRKSVMYIDTDSNMVSIYNWVKFIMDDVMKGQYPMDEDKFLYTSASVLIIILTIFIGKVLHTMCSYMNITDEWAKRLNMKNEFFYKRMIFTNVKKRYAGLMILKEGMIINDGEGDIDIKGFDFIKAGTKPSLKKFYSDLVLNDILRAENIDPVAIKKKIDKLRIDILNSIKSGNREFYKNANVSMVGAYKMPYRIQGIKAVLLWNTMFPDSMIELPSPVDIAAIKSFKNKKNAEIFAEKYPDLYKLIEDGILNNSNPDISGMDINVIAIPKGYDELPECVLDLIDIEKILQDSINLILPTMSSLGIRSLNCGTNMKRLSNIVSL